MAIISGLTINNLTQTTGLTPNYDQIVVYKSGNTGTEVGTHKSTISQIFDSQIFFTNKANPSLLTDGFGYIDAGTFPHHSVLSSLGQLFKSFVTYSGAFSANTNGEATSFLGGLQRSVYISNASVTWNPGGSTNIFGSAGSGDSWGTNNFPTSFFSSSQPYKSKTIHVKAGGTITNSGSNGLQFSMYFGGDLLTFSYLGELPIASTTNGWDMDLYLIISNKNVKHSGTFRTYATSGGGSNQYQFAPNAQDISSFTGGDLKMEVSNLSTISGSMTCQSLVIELLN